MNILVGYNCFIEHVGSTAVGGISAKPIIDIMIGSKLDNLSKIVELLKQNQYIYKGEAGIEGRHFLVKNEETMKQYENLKTSLAEKYADDREKYTESKTDFIIGVLSKIK